MRKNPFTETIKILKKFKKDNIFIQFDIDRKTTYIGYMHFIISMPTSCYSTFILPNVPGFPYAIDKNITYRVNQGQLKEVKMDFNEYFNTVKTSHIFYDSKMIFDLDTKKARAFLWENEQGETEGTLIDETYYQMSLEYSTGAYFTESSKKPIYTCNDDLKMIILPISGCNEFFKLLSVYNRELDKLTVKTA